MHRSALILSLVVALTAVLSMPIGVRSEKHISDRELKSIATRAPFFTGLPLGSVALERRQTVGSSSPGVAGGPSSPGIGEDPSSPGEAGQGEGQSAG